MKNNLAFTAGRPANMQCEHIRLRRHRRRCRRGPRASPAQADALPSPPSATRRARRARGARLRVKAPPAAARLLVGGDRCAGQTGRAAQLPRGDAAADRVPATPSVPTAGSSRATRRPPAPSCLSARRGRRRDPPPAGGPRRRIRATLPRALGGTEDLTQEGTQQGRAASPIQPPHTLSAPPASD